MELKNVKEFEIWVQNLLKDAQDKLHIEDKTIAWVLLREGTAYFFKAISKGEVK